MAGKRKSFSAAFKAKVALEAIRGISTTAEIALRHKVHPNQIAKWKKQLLENATSLFADGRSKTNKGDDGQLKDRLFQQIGQLQFELEWLKKKSQTPIEAKRLLVEPEHERLSIARQCALLGMSRAAYYYEPWVWDETALAMLRAIDEEYTRHPFLGKRRMCEYLQELGYDVGVKRARTLMAWLGLEAIYPKKSLSASNHEHKKYPYLLRKLPIFRPNQVWCSDITYVRQRRGFAYLTVVMDWFSRYVIAWELSTTLESDFCVRCLERALETGRPEIFNTDQGSQYTSGDFTGTLLAADVRISMNGAGRVFDNIMVERLWRSVKQEEVYLKEYDDAGDCHENLGTYFEYYNYRRRHSGLDARPAEIYFDAT